MTPFSLRATSSPLSGRAAAFDGVGVAADEGRLVSGRSRVVAGLGVAATITLPHGLEDADALADVVDKLRSIEHERLGSRDGGPSVMAVGAFPFDRTAPATLVIPRTSFCRLADGRSWAVRVASREDRSVATTGWAADEAVLARTLTGRPAGRLDPGVDAFRPPSLREVPPGAQYARAVAAAVDDIRGGRLHKVVLGRMVEATFPRPPAASAVLRRLWGAGTAFSPFSLQVATGRLVGASPELIVSRLGRTVTSHAFAGTVDLSGTGTGTGEIADAAADRLFASEKDREEHRWVVETIADTLGPRCDTLTVPAEPSVVRLRSDARLGTLIEGILPAANRRQRRERPDAGDTVLRILSALHPTPAVGGVPRTEALELIHRLEAAERGYWAGVVGWVDAAGDGEWVLAIRSVLLDGSTARIYAGAGIVEGSDPEAELAETTVKLRPVLDALSPGSSALL